MNAQRKQIIIIGVMGMVLCLVLAYQLSRPPPPPPKIEGGAAAPSVTASKTPAAGTPAAPGAPAAGTPAAPSAPAATTADAGAAKAPAATPGTPATAGTKPPKKGTETAGLKQSNVDVEKLLKEIEEVDFDYQREQVPRDVMRSLLAMAPPKPVSEGEGEGEATEQEQTGEGPRVFSAMKKKVTGIVWDSRRPLAVVDNEVVYPGYAYEDGITVSAIEPARVIFDVGGTPVPVELKELK